jgi:hypothetical protein
VRGPGRRETFLVVVQSSLSNHLECIQCNDNGHLKAGATCKADDGTTQADYGGKTTVPGRRLLLVIVTLWNWTRFMYDAIFDDTLRS